MQAAIITLAVLLILSFAKLSIGDVDGFKELPSGPAINFKVIGHDLTGNSYVFAADKDGNARLTSIQTTKSWVRVQKAPAGMRLYALWDAGKFGKVIVEADNGGVGYNAMDADYYLLNSEITRTRARKLSEAYKDAKLKGYLISAELAGEIETALTQSQEAEETKDETEKAKLADAALEKLLFANEKLVLERAQQDIVKYRMSDVTIKAVDGSGNAVSGASIEVKQISNDFLFGHNAMARNSDYRDLFADTLNFATIPFYLGGLAPKLNEYQWEKLENTVKWEIEHGKKCKGHPLTWFFEKTNPDYFKAMNWEQTVEFCKENTRKNIEHFKGTIDMWDVINEAHGWANGGYTQKQMDELTDIVTRVAKETNPNAAIAVNTCLPLGQYVQWDEEERSTPYEYFDRLNKMHVPYDIIGLQMYNGIASPFPTCDITEMSDIIDRFSKLGKPIHITEFSVPSDAHDWGYWHSNKWDEQSQAEYVKAFYTMAFSKPDVGAITWWCLWDAATWVKTTGILREDKSGKPAYSVLQDLIRSWRTNTAGKTDSKGEYSFRGFHGNYEVRVKANGKEQVVNLHVSKDQAQVTVKI